MSHDELVLLLRTYCTHRRFFYLDNFQSFKLFVSWYLQELCGTEYVGKPLPWYRSTYEVQQLAKILKCSEQDVLGILEEIHNDY